MSADAIRRLEQLGIDWDPLMTKWLITFEALKNYKVANADCNVPMGFKTTDGIALGRWLSNQRVAYKKGIMSDERVKRLKDLGALG